AVGQEAPDLKSAEAAQIAVLKIDRGEDARVDVGGKRQVAVGCDLYVIGLADLETIAAGKREFRYQPAACAFGSFRDLENRQQRDIDPKQLEAAALEAD